MLRAATDRVSHRPLHSGQLVTPALVPLGTDLAPERSRQRRHSVVSRKDREVAEPALEVVFEHRPLTDECQVPRPNADRERPRSSL